VVAKFTQLQALVIDNPLMRPALLVLMCAACGFPQPPPLNEDAGTDNTDASVGNDTGIDADGGPSNSPGAAHVTVVDSDGSPAIGIAVVFTDRDGTLVKVATTDSTGKAEAIISPGASATTVAVEFMQIQIRTVLDMKPGDDLVIGPRIKRSRMIGSFTLSWPDLFSHANSFWIYGPCGLVGSTVFVPGGGSQTAPTSITFPVTDDCTSDNAEFVVDARGDGGRLGFQLGWNQSATVPFQPGGSFTMSDNWDEHGARASYTNLSPSIDTITAVRITGGFSSLTQFSTMPSADPTTIATNGPKSASADIESVFNARSGATQSIRQRVPGSATIYNLNARATALSMLNTPTFDVDKQEFQNIKVIAEGNDLIVPDLLKIEATWTRPAGKYTWQIFGPDADAVKLPNLPAELGPQLNPISSDTLRISATTYESDIFDNYDSVRNSIRTAVPDIFESARSTAETRRTSKSPPPPPSE
jgi:hypothetical protein